MTCERCHGLMVSEQIYDLQWMNSDLHVDGYRCLLCGNLVDATILENRRRSIDTAGVLTLMNPRVPRLVVACAEGRANPRKEVKICYSHN